MSRLSASSVLVRCCFIVSMAAALGTSATAYAYCRETVNAGSEAPCDENSTATALFWKRNCLTYSFNANVFSRISGGEAFVRQVFNTAFQTWADVRCVPPTEPPFRVSASPSPTRTDVAEFVYDRPNESVVIVYTADEWTQLDESGNSHDPEALALTLLWHDSRTGEILDVDMELNGRHTFSDCAQQSCANGEVDLLNTITHEAGHLLGLGHTDVAGATMEPTAVGAETAKRDLAEDDLYGYCALQLPEGPCADCECPTPPTFRSSAKSAGCSVYAPGLSGLSGVVSAPLLIGLGLLLGLRRLSKRAGRV